MPFAIHAKQATNMWRIDEANLKSLISSSFQITINLFTFLANWLVSDMLQNLVYTLNCSNFGTCYFKAIYGAVTHHTVPVVILYDIKIYVQATGHFVKNQEPLLVNMIIPIRDIRLIVFTHLTLIKTLH